MPDALDGVALLRKIDSILVIDWPQREVPESLARSGIDVTAAEGPDLYNAYEMDDETVRVRRLAHAPRRADLVYAYRPLDELPEIIEQAVSLGARAVWLELQASTVDVARARDVVESAGLAFIVDQSIVAAARARRHLRAARASAPD